MRATGPRRRPPFFGAAADTKSRPDPYSLGANGTIFRLIRCLPPGIETRESPCMMSLKSKLVPSLLSLTAAYFAPGTTVAEACPQIYGTWKASSCVVTRGTLFPNEIAAEFAKMKFRIAQNVCEEFTVSTEKKSERYAKGWSAPSAAVTAPNRNGATSIRATAVEMSSERISVSSVSMSMLSQPGGNPVYSQVFEQEFKRQGPSLILNIRVSDPTQTGEVRCNFQAAQ